MKILATAAAAAALALGFSTAGVLPAGAATTADQAQCASARGSGDLNDIKLFCGRSELPSTAVRPKAVFGGLSLNIANAGNGRSMVNQHACADARRDNDQANIAFFCK